MIYLYSGTPGSGKSLHVARVIYYTLARKKPVICNFPINTKKIRNPHNFTFVDNAQLNPGMLMQYSRDYFGSRPVLEEGSWS